GTVFRNRPPAPRCGQPHVALRVVWILTGSLFEKLPRGCQLLGKSGLRVGPVADGFRLFQMVSPLKVGLKRLQGNGTRAREPRPLRGSNRRANFAGDRTGDVLFQCQNVLGVAFVAFRPKVCIGWTMNQLRRDSHATTRLLNRSFDDAFDAQFTSNFW